MKILLLAGGTLAGVPSFGRPALAVYGINNKDPDFTGFQIVAELIDHAEILVIAAHGILGRESQKRQAVMSVDHHMHVASQALAVMGYCFCIHESMLLL